MLITKVSKEGKKNKVLKMGKWRQAPWQMWTLVPAYKCWDVE